MRIAVVGGSIAGLEAAIRLAEENEVTLFEEHEEIGEPLQCAEGWVNVTPPYGHVVNSIDTVVIRRLDRDLNAVSETRIDTRNLLLVIDRPAMEREMAKIAEMKGAEIITGRRVKLSEPEIDDFDVVVDASGYPSLLGSRHKPGIAIQARCEYDCDELFLDYSPHTDGYFWIFPKGDGTANIGTGFWKKKAPIRRLLEKYMQKIGAEPVFWTGGRLGVGLNKPLVRCVNGKTVALVGDAAGLVDKFFGEGMVKAVKSSRVLADCINQNCIDQYERRLMKEIGMMLKFLEASYRLRWLTLRCIPVFIRFHKFLSRFYMDRSTQHAAMSEKPSD